jgi:hypothetical protein
LVDPVRLILNLTAMARDEALTISGSDRSGRCPEGRKRVYQ